MEQARFVWEVEHPEHEKVQVEAPDRLHAIVEAAHAWGIKKWTSIARACAVDLIGPAQKKKPTTAKGEKHGN